MQMKKKYKSIYKKIHTKKNDTRTTENKNVTHLFLRDGVLAK